MAKPFASAKCDARPGKEALVLISRPDSSTTKGEKQIIIRARDETAALIFTLGSHRRRFSVILDCQHSLIS